MTIRTYGHVQDDLIRSTLMGDYSGDSLAYTIGQTLSHAHADKTNEEIPFCISEQRLALALDAEEWWNEHGNYFECLQSLRAFWSI